MQKIKQINEVSSHSLLFQNFPVNKLLIFYWVNNVPNAWRLICSSGLTPTGVWKSFQIETMEIIQIKQTLILMYAICAVNHENLGKVLRMRNLRCSTFKISPVIMTNTHRQSAIVLHLCSKLGCVFIWETFFF